MEHKCRSCGASSTGRANFCSYCGVPAAAEYLGLVGDDEPNPEPDSRLTKVLVPVAVTGLIGLAGLALLGGGQGEPAETERESTIDAVPTPTPPATETPTPSRSFSVAAALLSPGDPIDPTRLPDTTATHLAVANGNNVHFLNLATGVWNTVDTGRELAVWGGSPRGVSNGVDAFSDGVLVQTKPNGRLIRVSVDGETFAITSSSSWLLGVRNNLAFVQESRFSTSNNRISAIEPDGSERFSVALPERGSAPGVTDSGLVVVQAGAGVYLAGPEQTSFLATGIVAAVVEDSVLVYDCDEQLACSTRLVNTASGDGHVVDLPAGRIETLPSADVLVHLSTGSTQRYRLVHDELVRIDLDETAPVGTMGSARDVGGTWASVGIDRIDFTPMDGIRRATIPFDVGPCCGPFGITFVTPLG